jgi:hypothetical protein
MKGGVIFLFGYSSNRGFVSTINYFEFSRLNKRPTYNKNIIAKRTNAYNSFVCYLDGFVTGFLGRWSPRDYEPQLQYRR